MPPKTKTKAEEFLNNTLQEKMLRERILEEHPELKSLGSYITYLNAQEPVSKKRAGNSDNISDEERIRREKKERDAAQKKYEAAFNAAIKEERIPDHEFVYEDQLFSGCKTYAEKSFKSYSVIYGANPVFVPEFAEKQIYNRKLYNQIYKPKNLGSFKNEEFTVLAYMSACDPDVIKGYLFPEHRKADHEGYIAHESVVYTINLNQNGPSPRPATVSTFGNFVITPARNAAEAAIAEYDKGNTKAMADKVTKGIRTIIGQIAVLRDFSKNYSAAAPVSYVLKETAKMLEARPELKEQVMNNLSAKEQRAMKAIINLGDLISDFDTARMELHKVKQGMVNHTVEEILNYKKVYHALKSVEKQWNEKTDDILSSEENVKFENDLKKMKFSDPIESHALEEKYARKRDLAKLEVIDYMADKEEVEALIESKTKEARTEQIDLGKSLIAPPVTLDNAFRSMQKLSFLKKEIDNRITQLEKEQKEIDNEFNRQFNEKRDELGKLREGSDAYKEARFDLDFFVDARMRELVDSYQKREISEHYLAERFKQLNALKANPNMVQPELPGFLDPNNQEQTEKFQKATLGMLKGFIFGKHLADEISFVKWKIKESYLNGDEEKLSADSFTDEEWRIMYQNEIAREALKNALPLPEGVVIADALTDEQRREVNIAAMDKDISKALGTAEKEAEKQVINPEEQRSNAILSFKETFANHITSIADAMNNAEKGVQKENGEKALYREIANTIGFGIIERHKGMVPGGLSAEEFNQKIAEESGFKNVVKPLVEEVCQQYKEMHDANPEIKVSDVPKAKSLIRMVEDDSILNVFAMQSRIEGYALEKAETGKEAISVKNSNEVNRNSHAIQHAKKLLNSEEKPANGPKMN